MFSYYFLCQLCVGGVHVGPVHLDNSGEFGLAAKADLNLAARFNDVDVRRSMVVGIHHDPESVLRQRFFQDVRHGELLPGLSSLSAAKTLPQPLHIDPVLAVSE